MHLNERAQLVLSDTLHVWKPWPLSRSQNHHKNQNLSYFLRNMIVRLGDATLALYADKVFPRRLLVPHFFEISDEFRRDL